MVIVLLATEFQALPGDWSPLEFFENGLRKAMMGRRALATQTPITWNIRPFQFPLCVSHNRRDEMAVLRDIKRDQEMELARLRAENDAYKRAAETGTRKISFKIGEKGGLSLYGLGRFPVT
jgi:hypothetical protein